MREFLVFRGFTNTLQAFEAELSSDVGKEFQVDRLLDLIFSIYIPRYQAENLVGLLGFFKQLLSSSATETLLVATLSKLEVSILRCYIVHAMRSGKRDKVIEFFNMIGNDLLQKGQDWTPWFGGCLPLVSLLSYNVSLTNSRACSQQFPMQRTQAQILNFAFTSPRNGMKPCSYP